MIPHLPPHEHTQNYKLTLEVTNPTNNFINQTMIPNPYDFTLILPRTQQNHELIIFSYNPSHPTNHKNNSSNFVCKCIDIIELNEVTKHIDKLKIKKL